MIHLKPIALVAVIGIASVAVDSVGAEGQLFGVEWPLAVTGIAALVTAIYWAVFRPAKALYLVGRQVQKQVDRLDDVVACQDQHEVALGDLRDRMTFVIASVDNHLPTQIAEVRDRVDGVAEKQDRMAEKQVDFFAALLLKLDNWNRSERADPSAPRAAEE
jgi:hypothetical protein